jgi:hypothetical protein
MMAITSPDSASGPTIRLIDGGSSAARPVPGVTSTTQSGGPLVTG